MPRAGRTPVAETATVFAALGDSTRLALVQRLSSGPASISTLALDCGADITRQGVTKHLRVLSSAGLAVGTRRGREQVWALNPRRLEVARRSLDLITRHWDETLARLKAHVERDPRAG